jgi:LytR cell envelope-related transcriptional attenuator
MNRPAGNSNGDVARGAGSAALKGALLIGVAVVVGLLLLQTVHDNKTKSASSSTPTTKPKTTTTKPKTTTTTTAVAHTVIPPSELKVIVLNAGAASGQAAAMSADLKQAKYTNQADANNWTGHTQSGNTVLCKPGLDQEAVALSQQVPLQGSSVKPWPTPAPPTYGYDADCVVAVGS